MINNLELNGAVKKMQKSSAQNESFDQNNNDKCCTDRNVPTKYKFKFDSSSKFNYLNDTSGVSEQDDNHENKNPKETENNLSQNPPKVSPSVLKPLYVNTNEANVKLKPSSNLTISHYYAHGNGGAIKRGCEDVENENEDDLVTSISSSTSCSRRSPPKKPKFVVTSEEMNEYFNLLHQTEIQHFLKRDACFLITDKYALAMVFTYFKRAKFNLQEYTKDHFYLALYLASDIEEDIDEYKYEIFPWALGTDWRSKFSDFLRKRDALLRRIGYRAIVSRKCCEEVMSFKSDHHAWKRERAEDHGGATRAYLINKSKRFLLSKLNLEGDELNLPRLPEESPRPCPICLINRGWNTLNNCINLPEQKNNKPNVQTSYSKGYSMIKRQKSNDCSKDNKVNPKVKPVNQYSKSIKEFEFNSETESENITNNTDLKKDSKMSAANKFQKIKMSMTELEQSHRGCPLYAAHDLSSNTENACFTSASMQRHSSLVSDDKYLIKDSFNTSDDGSSSEDDVFSVEKPTSHKSLIKKQDLLKLNAVKLRGNKAYQQNNTACKKRSNYTVNNAPHYNLRSHSVNAQRCQRITNQIVPIE